MLPFFSFFGIFALSTIVVATEAEIKGIIPTASGQIGVNPVDLPPASVFIGKIGKNTQYLTDLGSATSWIASDSTHVSKVTITTTGAGQAPATMTSDVSIAIATGDAGDLSVLTSPALRQGLENIAAKVPACAGARIRARSTLCGFDSFVYEAIQLGPLQEAGPALEEGGRLLIPAADIAMLIANFKAAAAGAATATVTASTMGLLWLAWDSYQSGTGKSIPPVLNIPSSVHTTASPTTTSITTTSSASCPKGTPICDKVDCSGKGRKCTVGDHAGCTCIPNGIEIPMPFDLEWLDIQQQILKFTEPPLEATCDTENHLGVESSVWKSVAAFFCKGNDLGSNLNRDLKTSDAGAQGYLDYTFNFGWKDSPGACAQSCEDVYAFFLKSTKCSLDSHTMSVSGTFTQDCGEASFKITKQTPLNLPSPLIPPYAEGSYADGFCSLDLTQWDKTQCSAPICDMAGPGYGNSRYSVAVTIKDAKGAEIGSSRRFDAGDPDRLEVRSKLEGILLITPEEQNDYIQFNLWDESWASNNVQNDMRALCKVESWEGDGSRTMHCGFACPYHGGKSSDGSN